MSDVMADWIVTGVNVVLAAMMIWACIALLGSTQELNNVISEQQVLAAEMDEYMEYNQYDFTHVYAQDIITAIYQYRGNPAIYVNSANGVYTWTLESAPCDYITAEIAALIDQDVIYDASIGYGKNGEVLSFNFVTHVAGCGR